MRRSMGPILAIFLTVFLDMLSFGLVIPDIQIRGERLGATGTVLGLLIASFSIAQLLAAPILGRWSDRIGRRKILLVSTILTILSFIAYSQATVLWVMFVSRVLQGLGGANLGVAYAYIADVTEPKDRAKSMGMIGAAFGLGFIFGPPLGGWLVVAGGGQPQLLGFTSAALAVVNFLFLYFVLKEPQRHESPDAGEERSPSLHNLITALRTPGLALLLPMFFAFSFGFSNLESTFFRLIDERYIGTGPGQLARDAQMVGGLILGFVGIVAAIMQGYVVRKVTPICGEVNMLRTGFILIVPALVLVPFAPPWVPMLAVTLLLGVGTGLTQPSISSLVSRTAPKTMQGGIFGVTQSLGALARILGPTIGNTLFDIKFWYPYALAGGIVLMPLLGAWWVRMPRDEHG